MDIITISNGKKKEVFFSTDHCQGVGGDRVHFITNYGHFFHPGGTQEIPSPLKAVEFDRLNSTVESLSESWVPCTAAIPTYVAPREGLEDGIISNLGQYMNVFYSDYVLVRNPDPRFEPRYSPFFGDKTNFEGLSKLTPLRPVSNV